MSRALIISTPFFGYHLSVARAFESLGYQVKVETYDEPIHPFRGLLKWRHKFSHNKEKLRADSRAKYARYIEDVFDKYQPEIVFSYNGTILLDSTLDYFRSKAKVIFWMYDSVLREDRTICKNHIDHADAVFCFENKDVDYYKSIGKTAYFLPLACDTSVYYPTNKGGKKDIDILFVGTIYISRRRIKLLNYIIDSFPELNIQYYGYYKPFFKNPIKCIFREKRKFFKNVNISPQSVNELFGRSKIALNIHNEQTNFGANQRLFEICGSGAYQICDYNPFIESLFPNKEVGLYRNEIELTELIIDALNNDKSLQASQARGIIINNHTFVKRVEQMLEILSSKI